jgi:hypothetical protein
MQVFGRSKVDTHLGSSEAVKSQTEEMRAIAYSMDTLIPGFYVWLGSFALRIGGSEPDDHPYRYPGVVHDSIGVALVLPGYRILTTYKGSYDPGQARN